MEDFKKKNFFSTGEVGRIFGVSRTAVYKWVKQGKLKAFKIPGGRFKIKKQDLLKFMRDSGMTDITSTNLAPASVAILIVDDEELIVSSLKAYLEKRNPHFSISHAADGFDAGKMVSRINPDIVILDLFLPGLDGFRVCREIKKDPATRSAKIIAITGYPSEENTARIKKAGAEMVFKKPFNYEKMEAAIYSLME